MRKGMWLLAGLLGPALMLASGSAEAQERAEGDLEVIYEREVFQYSSAGRPDPFRSLLRDGDLGIRVDDLMLRGVVHHPDPSRSVAILTQEGSEKRIQARVGERVGALRILSIHPDRVDIVIEELGVARRETLQIVQPEQREQGR